MFTYGCNESCGTGGDWCDAPRSVTAVKAELLSSWDIGEISVAVRLLFGAAGLLPWSAPGSPMPDDVDPGSVEGSCAMRRTLNRRSNFSEWRRRDEGKPEAEQSRRTG